MQTLKPMPKWNTGHFPVGTVVTIENVFCKVLPEAEREFEDQLYGYSKGTVTDISTIGPDNYCIDLTGLSLEEDPLGCGSTNIQWVRYIHSRGKDSCAPKASMSSDILNHSRTGMKSRNQYHNYAINDLVRFNMDQIDSSGAHLYDFDKIVNEVMVNSMVRSAMVDTQDNWPTFKLQKKAFRKLVKRVMFHNRKSVKLASKEHEEMCERIYRLDY